MILTPEELRDVFEVLVKPAGHPDAMGLMARALLTSEGDPDYIDINGKQGFIPLDPDRAMLELGTLDVQSLEGNIMTAIALDIKYFDQYRDLKRMITATHQSADTASAPTAATSDLINALPEAKIEVRDLMFPPLATVNDVISVLRASTNSKPTKARLTFFKELLNGQ